MMGSTSTLLTTRSFFLNSTQGCSAQGSGISYTTWKAFGTYQPTADDINANNNAALNLLGVQGPSFPFRGLVAWNVSYNNAITNTACNPNSNTDGNGIIMDTLDNSGANHGTPYPGQILIAFNVVANNGGQGIKLQNSSSVTVANNSSYNNNYGSINNSGTERPELESQPGTPYGAVNTWFNNVAYSLTGSSGPSNTNTATVTGGSNACSGSPACGTWSNNLTYCTGTPANGGCNQTYNGNPSYSCTSNKCQTTASWVNVGNTSKGTASTPPSGFNFALQSSSGAIGYGQTRPYLPAQSVDAGACHHALTSCP
jgi:hypothetical protein